MLDSIFMQVLDMSNTASIVILVVLLARLLLKKAPKVFSYVLWAVVLFRLLCPVTFEAAVSIMPEMASVSQDYSLSEAPISMLGAAEAAYHAVGDAVNGGLGVQDIRTTEKDGEGRTKYVGSLWWDVWILFGQYVWVAGIGVMLLYSAVSYLKIRKKLLVVVPLRDNIFLADDIKSPFVVGLFRPKIYLPCNLEEKEQEYIILHEQYHIKRLDHIIKALAFLALAIHWFNPLVWVAFILASKDMEMSCDEAVIGKIGDDVRADYSASLLTLATGRRIIAGTPLAFGEGDTKGRIRNLANWRKPAFWVVLISVVACIALAVGLLTNPGPAREFPINGSNVSELDTEQIIDMIAKAERLEKNSQLYVYEENLMINEDFDWLFDGSLLRFYYFKSQKTYSGQLKMSRDENRYFIADTEEWAKPELIYRLSDYLDALKYMPQDEIRQLYPNADTYVVSLLSHGSPSDYQRVITYTQNGMEDIDGWNIHLMVSPTYEAEPGGYYGSDEELLHLFYHSTGKTVSTAINTYVCEYDSIIGRFDIALGADGSFTYLESRYSSYLGHGTWELSGDLITLTENVRVEDIPINRINYFKLDGDDLVYVAKDSSNFPHVKLDDGDRFHCTDEAFNVEAPQRANVNQTDTSGTIKAPSIPVAWTYSPMMSATWHTTFYFEFAFDYTHIEANCDQGELWNLHGEEQSHNTEMQFEAMRPVCWTPSMSSSLAEKANVDFSVYDDETKLYTGRIEIKRLGAEDVRTVYEARLVNSPNLYMLYNASGFGAKIITAPTYDAMTSPDTVIWNNADLDHDGRNETIHVRELYDGMAYELSVVKQDGTILWSTEAHTAHAGYNSLFVCALDGVDYLLQYHPTMYQGDCNYTYRLFALDAQGRILINREASVNFDTNWGSSLHSKFNAVEIADFMDEINDLLAHSKLLLNTDSALDDIDPENPQDIPWWLLDKTFCSGYVYDESKTLRDNLLELERFVNS